VVTNQSAVGRGISPLSGAQAINQRLEDVIRKAGGRIDGFFLCPHAPEQHCACRKPQPGLILEAADRLQLDPGRSILVGDALSDIQAGQNAGVRTTVLVRTGRGAAQLLLPAAQALAPFLVYDRLMDVCNALLSGEIHSS
jgi:D-glycero-D-manno-heptose 1,7-bisphosphate phosphatase